MSVYRQAADRMAKAASLCPEGDAVLVERGGKTRVDRLDLCDFP